MAFPLNVVTTADVDGTTRPGSKLAMLEAEGSPAAAEARIDVLSPEGAEVAALALESAARIAEVYLASQPIKLGRKTFTVSQMSPSILIAAGKQDQLLSCLVYQGHTNSVGRLNCMISKRSMLRSD